MIYYSSMNFVHSGNPEGVLQEQFQFVCHVEVNTPGACFCRGSI